MHAMTRCQNGQRHNLLTLAENVLIHLAGEICDNVLVDCIKGKSSSTGRPCAYCPCNSCNITAQLQWANGRITDLEYQEYARFLVHANRVFPARGILSSTGVISRAMLWGELLIMIRGVPWR